MNYHALIAISLFSSLAFSEPPQKDTPPARADESPARTEARDRVAKDKADLNQKLKEKAPTAEIHGVKTRLQRDRTFENREDVNQKIKEDQKAKADANTPQSH
ncbi:hypothetical protein B9G69_013345 [Bdellovibrio sp. SKB1291214]|uniref:hypothetical protein n=1 Tax=Bdellovibrio sp. SKB1291214 TaxID=1732569 RepID=UPI000B51A241|nr:hypothetical protein [Bdellovibrio sp. SKB1291214]UYL08030.1 hypothetical protein B9G69_013345 [Bdellovibrio sp. SKB1291214]